MYGLIGYENSVTGLTAYSVGYSPKEARSGFLAQRIRDSYKTSYIILNATVKGNDNNYVLEAEVIYADRPSYPISQNIFKLSIPLEDLGSWNF